MNGLNSSSMTAPFGARENIWNATGARMSPTPSTISAMRTFRRIRKSDQTGRVLSKVPRGRGRDGPTGASGEGRGVLGARRRSEPGGAAEDGDRHGTNRYGVRVRPCADSTRV